MSMIQRLHEQWGDGPAPRQIRCGSGAMRGYAEELNAMRLRPMADPMPPFGSYFFYGRRGIAPVLLDESLPPDSVTFDAR